MLVEIIYTEGFSTEAGEAVKKLSEFKGAEVKTRENGYVVIDAGKSVRCDTVIVFVTDDVTDNELWRERVLKLSSEKKIILVSRIRSGRLSDHIPENIRKVNAIRLDESGCLDELWDAINSDKEYYIVINSLYSMAEGWELSGYSDLYLIHDLISAVKYYRNMKAKLKSETKPYYRNKLEKIIPYLKKSMVDSFNVLSRSISKTARFVSILAVALVLIYASVMNIPKYFSIAGNAGAVCLSTGTLYSPVQTLRAVEAIRNPFVNDNLKDEAFNLLNDQMCDNWPNTVVANFYKYSQNDFRVCSDDRYIIAASGNGYCITWDTYNGNIVKKEKLSDRPLYVIDTFQGEENIIAADEDGSVFWFNGGKWISSDSLISDYGYAVGISLSECGASVVTDQCNIVMLSLGENIDVIRSFSFDDILAFKQCGDQVLAMVKDGNGDHIIKISGEDGIIDDLDIDIETDTYCNADIMDDDVLFASSDGGIYICHFNDKSIEKLHITYSQPVILRFVNETAIYCNDRNRGNCLYDYRHKIDIGSFLPEAGNVYNAVCGGNTVVCGGDGNVYSENVSDLLPKETIDGNIYVSYEGTSSQSGGTISNAEITGEKYIIANLNAGREDEFNYLVDGGHYYIYTSPDKRNNATYIDELQFTYSVPSTAVFTGVPTVVGVSPDGNSMVIGASDGYFYELLYLGNMFYTVSKKQIPSGSAVTGIYLSDNCYYIKDQDGLYWKARYGGRSMNSDEDLYNEINAKLHMGMNDDIKDSVSNAVLKNAGVVYAPGHDGKVWE